MGDVTKGTQDINVMEEMETDSNIEEMESFDVEKYITENDTIDAENSLKIYLKQIGSTPLLTPEEEREIGKRAKQGDEKAVQALITANLRLVVWYITKDKNYENQGLDLMDLIQQGNLGLIRAAQKYDYEKGIRFSTYAIWHIRQSIQRGIVSGGRAIRMPVYKHEQIRMVNKSYKMLQKDYGSEVSKAEIAKQTGISIGLVEECMRLNLPIISLDEPATDDDDNTTLMDYVEDQKAEDPCDKAIDTMLREIIFEALDELKERERLIIIKRYGLLDNRQMTLEEIGKELGVTKERIRQIESNAMKHLRLPRIKNKFADMVS